MYLPALENNYKGPLWGSLEWLHTLHGSLGSVSNTVEKTAWLHITCNPSTVEEGGGTIIRSSRSCSAIQGVLNKPHLHETCPKINKENSKGRKLLYVAESWIRRLTIWSLLSVLPWSIPVTLTSLDSSQTAPVLRLQVLFLNLMGSHIKTLPYAVEACALCSRNSSILEGGSWAM